MTARIACQCVRNQSTTQSLRTNSASFATLAAMRCASIAIPAEEKYEHTNRSCNQKTPARVPCLCSGLGGNDGPSASVAQTEWLYWGPLHSQAT